MKIAVLFLLCAGVGAAQTAKPIQCHDGPCMVQPTTACDDVCSVHAISAALLKAETSKPKVAAIQGILTPDQQAAFPENVQFGYVPAPSVATTISSLVFMGPNGQPTFTLKAEHIYDKNPPTSATLSFDQPGSGRIDRLSDDEYAELQKLRDALATKEREIAKAHGVSEQTCVPLDNGTLTGVEPLSANEHGYCAVKNADHYEYRGQFLLVNVPEPHSAE